MKQPNHRGRHMDGWVTSAISGKVILRAGDDSLALQRDDQFMVTGLAGRAPTMVHLREFVLVGKKPEILDFLQAHDVVEVELDQDLADYGGTALEFRAKGCTLEDVRFVESMDGNKVEYILAAREYTGRLW